MDVRLAPFDLLVADICERTYEAKTPIGDLAFKVVGAALAIGLFLGLDEPAEAKRLLDPHPDANPDTASLESIVGSLVDQYVTPEYVAECRRLTAAQGLPVAILTTAYLVDSYQHSFGGLDESRRMPHFAGLANHALRFGLRLAQRSPKVAREVKASQA